MASFSFRTTLQVIVEIFNHIYESNKGASIPIFDYSITYEIEGQTTVLTGKEELFSLDTPLKKKYSVKSSWNKGIAQWPINIYVYPQDTIVVD